MKINNKDLIQSYIITAARYDFSAYEKKILYRIIESLQVYVKDKTLVHKHKIDTDLFGDYHLTFQISDFLIGENDKNHVRIKEALRSLRNKTIEYEDDEIWTFMGIIENPEILKSGTLDTGVKFRLHRRVFDAFLDFSKGFTKYELKRAMSFESVYAMRFYELMSGQKKPITYTIDNLKLMFKIQEKYTRINDFLKKVVSVAKKELDKKSPYSFEYKINKIGRSFHSITLYPVYNPEHRDAEIEARKLRENVSLRWDLDKLVINYLKENYLFSDNEIKNNLGLFKRAQIELDLLYFLSTQKMNAEKKTNPKGWIINAIKKQLEQKKNPSQGKKTDFGRASKTQSVEDVLKGLNL